MSNFEIKVEREVLFQDILCVENINYSKFERTPRLTTKGEFTDASVLFDVNIESYPVDIHDRINLSLYNNVSPSGSILSDFYDHDPRILGNSVMDEYEYVCYGRVYKKVKDKGKEGNVTIIISFGGLLMKITCVETHIKNLELDDYCYMLMRKEV